MWNAHRWLPLRLSLVFCIRDAIRIHSLNSVYDALTLEHEEKQKQVRPIECRLKFFFFFQFQFCDTKYSQFFFISCFFSQMKNIVSQCGQVDTAKKKKHRNRRSQQQQLDRKRWDVWWRRRQKCKNKRRRRNCLCTRNTLDEFRSCVGFDTCHLVSDP